MALKPAVFLDKDGTLLVNDAYNVDPARMRLDEGVEAGLRRLGSTGAPMVVITNQPGVALGLFEEEALIGVHLQLARMFENAHARLHGFYYCPHLARGVRRPYALPCTCRKPQPGLLRQAARDLDLDLERSWFIGDILDDVEAGRRAGCRTVLLNNGHETEWVRGPFREPDYIVDGFEQAAAIVAVAMRAREVA
ncbi:HAD-IIIA family hydrolase [Pigmentiphaga sp. CHJ604]|uniref:D-glycero-alpha-D-manno-heptose-1,7-bisphosphate 7-phosphatase n=1 Tax=Pigmentiphaga sp. CHJ604 TaxID=3081984 RepID=UPI0030CB414A